MNRWIASLYLPVAFGVISMFGGGCTGGFATRAQHSSGLVEFLCGDEKVLPNPVVIARGSCNRIMNSHASTNGPHASVSGTFFYPLGGASMCSYIEVLVIDSRGTMLERILTHYHPRFSSRHPHALPCSSFRARLSQPPPPDATIHVAFRTDDRVSQQEQTAMRR